MIVLGIILIVLGLLLPSLVPTFAFAHICLVIVVYEPLVAVRRGASIQPQVRNVLHDSLAGPVADRVRAEFGVRDAELRVELVASHLVGLAFARYQFKIEPLASAEIEDVIAWVGPTVERYLTNPSPIA